MSQDNNLVNIEQLASLKEKKDVLKFLKHKSDAGKKLAQTISYENELEDLQIEMVKLQRWVQNYDKRVAIIFEGRDAAGKGGSIRRFTEHLSPRAMRVVALPKPTDLEKGQWYFQRYVNQLPNEGEIVFFDRSWYNRAVVEPVNGFCTAEQYNRFMLQVKEFEHMLIEDGIILIKFWFSITKEEQKERFDDRRENPLKQWKISPVDQRAQELWDKYSEYIDLMFIQTHTEYCPWIIINANSKKKARCESIKYVLSKIPYEKSKKTEDKLLKPDHDILYKYDLGGPVLKQ